MRAAIVLFGSVLLSACVGGAVHPGHAASAQRAPPDCKAASLQVNGHALWVDLEGSGSLTVVFEAGGGNDSTAWSDLAPRVRALGVRTFVYDRAGLGRSDVDPSAYSIGREVGALRSALDQCRVQGPIVFVGHSYGGVIGLLASARDERIAGIVLLDTIVPGFYTPERIAALLAEYRPQYAEVREKAPKLAQAMIPLMEATPQTVEALDRESIPVDLPITDVVAERSNEKTPEAIAAWKSAHQAFVAKSPSRMSVLAVGSGHKVMQDAPDLVLETVARMIATVGARH